MFKLKLVSYTTGVLTTKSVEFVEAKILVLPFKFRISLYFILFATIRIFTIKIR